MSVIITCGFQPVDLSIFRDKSISKGKKLVDSNHVGNVKEVRLNCESKLIGEVLRQTPGATSTRKKENIYKPTVELDQSRVVVETHCTCKGGNGRCKHAAAICIFINEENTLSKTDAPMVWNRPPDAQFQKYNKRGCRIMSLFPSAKGNLVKEVFQFEDIQHILNNATHMSERSELILNLEAAVRCRDETEERLRVATEKARETRENIEALFGLQNNNNFIVHHAYSSSITENQRLKLTVMKCPEPYEVYYVEHVIVTDTEWKEICFQSVNQSTTVVWHNERHIRITASSKAHKIRTRKDNFEGLAKQFVTDTYKGRLTEAMQYGITLESVARIHFAEEACLTVKEVGLVICMMQPYLGCSPDGVVFNNGTLELLEIKCPYTCQDSKIVDLDAKICHVPYLFFTKENKLELKESHQYYTQVQLSLYITGMSLCHFVVFSSLDFVHIRIERNEKLLSCLIPKIEQFYFEYLIPIFANKNKGAN